MWRAINPTIASSESSTPVGSRRSQTRNAMPAATPAITITMYHHARGAATPVESVCGPGWIRTNVAVTQWVYSPSPLATRVPTPPRNLAAAFHHSSRGVARDGQLRRGIGSRRARGPQRDRSGTTRACDPLRLQGNRQHTRVQGQLDPARIGIRGALEGGGAGARREDGAAQGVIESARLRQGRRSNEGPGAPDGFDPG